MSRTLPCCLVCQLRCGLERNPNLHAAKAGLRIERFQMALETGAVGCFVGEPEANSSRSRNRLLQWWTRARDVEKRHSAERVRAVGSGLSAGRTRRPPGQRRR